jgi:hypothetical protein
MKLGIRINTRICIIRLILIITALERGVRRSVFGLGTIRQAGRSRVRFPMRSLDFSTYLILQGDIWPWGRFSI